MLESILNEFREEAATTRRVLERVPPEKLSWKPHPKSMSLGQLANHIARVPGHAAKLVQQDSFDVLQGNFVPPEPSHLAEIMTAFEASTRETTDCLTKMTEQTAQEPWRLMRGSTEVFTQPRLAIIRTIMLSHWYHHRGQLSVYLRLLDVPVPVIYGRSADESPFG
jgi:uncharacterized damage-inducible protein DinB